MIITVQQIENMLTDIWPGLNQVWCFDQEYVYPTLEDIKQFVAKNSMDISDIKAENPDCDDFALQLHAKVKRFHNWSFGEAFCNKVAGWSVLHNLNICVCQEGVFLIDPKPNRIWQADTTNDNILWVRI